MDWNLIPKLRKLVGFLTVVVDNTYSSTRTSVALVAAVVLTLCSDYVFATTQVVVQRTVQSL